MPVYEIEHITRYTYDFPVAVSHHTAVLEPVTAPHQSCQSFVFTTSPACRDLSARVDYFGNRVRHFSILENHRELEVTAHSCVVVHNDQALPVVSPSLTEAREYLQNGNPDIHALDFLYPSPLILYHPTVEAFARARVDDHAPLTSAIEAFFHHLHEAFAFDPDATAVDTPPHEFLKLKRGVCQDFTHLSIAVLRSLGIPARYISGYILTHPPEGQPRLRGADASHAWVSALIPGIGWFDFDPTNNKWCGDEYTTVACGRDYSDVAMVRGAITGGGNQQIDVAVTVMPVNETAAPAPPPKPA